MLRARTLFVLGAGASCEAKLPAGDMLKESIATAVDIRFRNYNEQFSGDGEIAAALSRVARTPEWWRADNINGFLPSAWHIAASMPQARSIDAFIDEDGGRETALIGKLAIAKEILDAERGSHLFFDANQGEGLAYKQIAGPAARRPSSRC